MLAPDNQTTTQTLAAGRPAEIALWLAIAAAWTVAWCWASVLLAERFAPVIVLPLFVGLVLGAGCTAAMRWSGLGSRRWLLAGTLVLSLTLAAGQHYIWYRSTQAHLEQAYARQLSGNKLGSLALNLPDLHPGFGEFLRSTAERGRAWCGLMLHGAWVWASWALDAVIESAAAVAFVALATRRPYCPRCRSWYRTVRRGKLRPAQAAGLARLCGCPGAAQARQYRLLHCQSGCGAAHLELSGDGREDRGAAWLDEAARGQALQLLDQETPAETESSPAAGIAPASSTSTTNPTAKEQA